jgi:hypothetical protein
MGENRYLILYHTPFGTENPTVFAPVTEKSRGTGANASDFRGIFEF